MQECELKFPDGSSAIFNIEPLSLNDQKIIWGQCHKKGAEFNFVNFQKGIDFDLCKFNRLVILRTVKGWSELRNKHLLLLYDKDKQGQQWQFHGDGKDETEIPFSENTRRELADMRSEFFMTWLDFAFELINGMRKRDLCGTGFHLNLLGGVHGQ